MLTAPSSPTQRAQFSFSTAILLLTQPEKELAINNGGVRSLGDVVHLRHLGGIGLRLRRRRRERYQVSPTIPLTVSPHRTDSLACRTLCAAGELTGIEADSAIKNFARLRSFAEVCVE